MVDASLPPAVILAQDGLKAPGPLSGDDRRRAVRGTVWIWPEPRGAQGPC